MILVSNSFRFHKHYHKSFPSYVRFPFFVRTVSIDNANDVCSFQAFVPADIRTKKNIQRKQMCNDWVMPSIQLLTRWLIARNPQSARTWLHDFLHCCCYWIVSTFKEHTYIRLQRREKHTRLMEYIVFNCLINLVAQSEYRVGWLRPIFKLEFKLVALSK